MYIWMESLGRIELELSGDQVNSVAQPGDNESAVMEILPNLRSQLDQISDDLLAECLKEYGAWSDDELQNRHDNEMRLVWIACHDINDDPEVFAGNN